MHMKFTTEQILVSKIKALGESASATCFSELVQYCQSESPLVRRIAASALGKLAGVVDAKTTVSVLQPMLADTHPQVRQSSIGGWIHRATKLVCF